MLTEAVFDLYSDKLLSKSMEPVFHNYYNTDFRNGFSMPVHSHRYIEIMYVRKGNCEVFAKDTTYRLESGDFILINGSVPHQLSVDRNTPCKVLCLEFDFSYNSSTEYTLAYLYSKISEIRFFMTAAKDVLKLKDSSEIYIILNEIYKELEHNEAGSQVFVKSAFGQFIIRLARLFHESENNARNPSDKYIRDAIAFMNNNYHEDLSIEQVAAHVNLNVSYFYKIFKQITGDTPMNFLNSIRINKAKLLLEKSDISIIDICEFVGFNSRQYFTSAFKRHTGLTPREYKRNFETGATPVKANESCYGYIISSN